MLYELTTTRGFVLNIYQSKGTLIDQVNGHTYEVVMNLPENYIDKGHVTFMDNFYNIMELAGNLKK